MQDQRKEETEGLNTRANKWVNEKINKTNLNRILKSIRNHGEEQAGNIRRHN